MKYKHIIWDWNGTLFNDVDACIETINELLLKRNLKLIKSREYYQEIFCFPVINYYHQLGFNFNQESFETVADEYVDCYHDKCKASLLMDGAYETIKQIDRLKIKQTVISASEQSSLNIQIAPFKIKNMFEDVIGIEDNLAFSKVDLARSYLKGQQLNNHEVLFVGDTIHDYEVAKSLGCNCVLISQGHQSKSVLNKQGATVVDNLKDLINLIKE